MAEDTGHATATFAAAWVVNVRHDAYDVYVGRASRGAPACAECDPEWGAAGQWGNEFIMRDGSNAERERVVGAHRASLLRDASRVARVRSALAGRRLGCWCSPRRCHADTLAEVANCSEDHLQALLAAHSGGSY